MIIDGRKTIDLVKSIRILGEVILALYSFRLSKSQDCFELKITIGNLYSISERKGKDK